MDQQEFLQLADACLEHFADALEEFDPDEEQALRPRPDNVFLLTDGLPTLDRPLNERSRFARKTVDESRRIGLFGSALEKLPRGIPVNVLLYPLEGDPHAAQAYWALAQSTGGSFISPASDWP